MTIPVFSRIYAYPYFFLNILVVKTTQSFLFLNVYWILSIFDNSYLLF
jgi:hypothetical protein